MYYNPGNLYAKLLIFRYYKADKVVKTFIFPVVISGTSRIYLGNDRGPLELISILRRPPGDESYIKFRSSQEMTFEISMSYSKTNSETQTDGFSTSVGFSKGPISAKTKALEVLREYFSLPKPEQSKLPWQEIAQSRMGINPQCCSKCGGVMHTVKIIPDRFHRPIRAPTFSDVF